MSNADWTLQYENEQRLLPVEELLTPGNRTIRGWDKLLAMVTDLKSVARYLSSPPRD